MRLKKTYLLILGIFKIYLIVHAFRDLMQLFGIHNFITDFYHFQGIKDTNKILNLIGMQYRVWTEIPMLLIEVILIKMLHKMSKKQKLFLLNIK
ncbi:MAG TPA: hypothetical protein VN174_04105 [Candidatus Methanoperedens sp.]|nr:hypothetical protein [Candidatus Methanoperedens sp.]